MTSLLSASNISKKFGSGPGSVTALKDISLELSEAELILVSGPSGSGKTTLLQVLGLLMRPDNGSLTVLDQPVAGLSDDRVAKLRLRTFGFVYQDFKLIRALTAVENVMLPLIAAKESPKIARQKAVTRLEQLGMSGRLNANVESLSGGEKQRVAIARALVNDPKIILADEPTANLDTVHGQQIMEILKTAGNSGLGIIVVSHDERLDPYATRKLSMLDGRLR
ncbi:MAG: ABC transporter ATP-binding protein [Candidatus Berkelbacteria bacterium]|nr:ABC transporter ATP-binding protein [Candidatus Berkelbacteria bacterium]